MRTGPALAGRSRIANAFGCQPDHNPALRPALFLATLPRCCSRLTGKQPGADRLMLAGCADVRKAASEHAELDDEDWAGAHRGATASCVRESQLGACGGNRP